MQVTPSDEGHYVGDPGHGGFRIYGGLIVAQAMDAARKSCPQEFTIQSIHGQFLRPGDYDHMIDIEVQELKDGRRFKLYNIYCRQQGKVIFFATITFHLPEPSFEHTLDAPLLELPHQDTALFYHQRDKLFTAKELAGGPTALEVRMEEKYDYYSEQSPEAAIWFKTADTLDLSDWQQTLLLAYVSDWNMPSLAMRPHAVAKDERPMLASLDHTIWFYRQADLHNWVAYIQDSPSALNSRGHTRGLLYNHGGDLLACVSQESFLSKRPHPSK